MGNRRHIPVIIKKLVVHLAEELHEKPRDIKRQTQVHERTQRRVRALHRTTGQVVRKPLASGRPRKLNGLHIAFLESCIERRPDIYLCELRVELMRVYGIKASKALLSNTLHRRGLRRMKLTCPARERDEEDRARFREIVSHHYEPEQLVFVDESAVNRKTGKRLYGWAPVNGRARVRDFFVRGQRYSVLPALSLDGILHLDVIPRAYNTEAFNSFVEGLLEQMNPFPQKNSVIVLDNASIHKSGELREMVEQRGMRLLFLPAYSPDFNPIEEAFSSMKAWLRANREYMLSEFCDVGRDGDGDPYAVIWEAVFTVTPEKSYGWFKDCGYF